MFKKINSYNERKNEYRYNNNDVIKLRIFKVR